MTQDVIPEDIRQFLSRYIDCIAQWEGLLLLHADRQVNWDAAAIAEKLYLSEVDAASILSFLAAQGFLAVSGPKQHIHYHYAPRTPELEELTARAAELYRHYLIPMTHFIHTKPKQRVREFADAFRIRKE